MSNLEWSKMTDEQLFTKAPTPDEIRQQERERIIKLLDEAFVYDEPVVIQRDRLIALIKNSGESKEAFVIPSRKNTNE